MGEPRNAEEWNLAEGTRMETAGAAGVWCVQENGGLELRET